MTKSYFMRTFNINIKLPIFTLFNFIIDFVLHPLALGLKNNSELSKIELFKNCSDFLQRASEFMSNLGMVLLLLFILSVSIELIIRLKNDSILNYVKSCWLTFKLRRFLVQNERSIKGIETTQVQTSNPIYADFNTAVRKSIVEISIDRAVIYIKLPHTQQAQKILKDMVSQIKEEISSKNPDFYFSAPNRTKNAMWFTGTKR
ncbi:hypothetical protein [Pseudolactococcus yaeyamensis]